MNKTGSKILHGLLLATSGLVGSTLIASTAAMAGGGPAGGTVAVGAATIVNASPTQIVINQSSKKALINWNSFSIPAGSSVKFNQPTSKSLAVNRVTGPNASTIDGQLLANGNVWLINANGVLFGKGSQVNVGSLLATTSDLSDDDFQKGNYSFNPAANPNASVVNKGTITAGRGGSVVLSAPSVSNEGLIHAELGTVVLGGAKAFTVDMTGDNLLRYEITAPVDSTPRDANGNAASALLSNSGTIMAAGGHVMMTARAARNIENNVINNTGMVEATTVSSHNGEIDLDAGPDGTANAGGTLDVSGAAQGQTGGAVNVTGGTVNVADGAKIDASGNAGGGTVQIGGGLHGQGTLAHSQRTIIGGATITADATAKGNGGTVAVWSDGATSFAGTISAKGGAQGGNGGQVETSGHTLGVAPSAKVDTSAPLGLTGDWLLDPADLVITSCLTDQSCCGSVTCVDSASITTSLGTTDITETASNSLTVASNSDIIWNSAHSLSLLSQGDIDIKSSIQNAGTGAINVVAGWDGTTTTLADLTSPGVYGLNNQGNVTISGDISDVSVGSAGGSVLVEGFNVSVNANGGYAQIGYDGAGTGNITVNAQNDVMLYASDDNQCDACYAQIGNGGAYISANVGGNINVSTGDYISLTGGAVNTSYAQIGNGGYLFDGAIDGNIFIQSNDTVTLTGGEGYAQIGNGGAEANGTISGNISVVANGNIALSAGSGAWGYAQIGNGGEDAHGGTGDIVITSSNGSILLDGGSDYAEIGNGGFGTTDDGIGNITISAAGNLTLTAGEGGASQIGNGGSGFSGNVSGNIAIQVNGTTSIGGAGWIGNRSVNGTISGDVSIITRSGYIGGQFLGADLQNGNVLLGWTGGDIEWHGFNYNSTHTFSVLSTGSVDVQGNIANNGTGAINLIAGWDGQTTNLASLRNAGVFGKNLGSITIDGSSNNVSVGSAGGTTTVLGYDVDVLGGNGNAQIGYNGVGTGNTVVQATHDLLLTAGAGGVPCCGCGVGSNRGYAQIGNGGSAVSGPDSGDITVNAANNVTLTAGPSTYSYASIGNGGDTGSHGDSGNIIVTAGGSVSLTGGKDYAQIGNGQWGSTDSGGDITVTAAQNINLTAADAQPWGYAQIGDGGQTASGNISGNVQVNAGGALTLTAGNNGMYAQIGNGADKAAGGGSKTSGNISISAGSLSLIGSTSGAGTDSYAQIGNTAVFDSGVSGSGAATGDININVTGATAFTSTFGQGHVWIGNVGANGGSETGAVSILSGTFNSDNENNDDIQNFVVADLAGGNLTIGVESAAASLNIGDELDYSSANNLTLLTAGNLTIRGGIQNAGSGNIMLVTGWNPNVTPANVPTTLGSYGNGNTGFSLGGSSATSNSMIGSALGTTTVLTNNLDISAVHGTAGLGFEGAASGNIVVSALGNVAVVGQSSDIFALIGNLGTGNQAVSGNVTIADAGSFTLTNGTLGNLGLGDAAVSGNVGLTASSLAVSGASVLSGTSAVITLTGAGASVGSASNPLLTDVNAIAVVTSNGSAYISAPKNGLSVGVGNSGINLGTGNLVLNAGGAIGQTAAIGANGLTVTASGGIALNNSGNSFATAALTSSGDASVYDATALSIAGATATGNLTLASGGSIGQTAAIKAASLTVSGSAIALNNSGNSFATAALTSSGDASVYDAAALSIAGATATGNLTLASGGSIGQTAAIKAASLTVSGSAIALNNAANSYGAISLNTTGSFSASIVDSSDLTVGNVNVGGDVTLRTKGDLTFTKSIQLQNGALLAIAGWDGVAAGATASGYGNNGGDIFIGGGNASDGVAIGSASGTTTLAGANITLSATNGYVQIGYHGGGSGAINLLATGNVALNGGGATGYFAQIGDGGYKVLGSSGEAVSVIAGGDIGLNAGAGQEAYAQIGNGGAESNGSSSGYSETGLVTVSGKTITLAAGSGTGSYAQIGHGGYKSGQAINGIATLGGNIAVNAVNAIRLIGGGIDAYAQIGQGGNFLNNGAANGSSGTLSGDIAVAVATPNTHTGNDPLTLTAGTGANSFAQIGNGGQGENIPATGAKATFTVSGNVTVADLTLTGSNTGANGYAQIGNGDASKTGFGNVSGQVTLGQGTDITYVPGNAPGSSTGLGNATGIGSVTGTLPNSGVNAGTQGSVASINQNSTGPTNFNVSMVTVTPQITLLNFSDKGTTSQGPTPFDQLANNSNSEGQTASDSVSQSVGQSLGDGKTIYVTSKTLIPGMLKQIVTLTRNNPNGIPPADEDYSSWGNEALWRW